MDDELQRNRRPGAEPEAPGGNAKPGDAIQQKSSAAVAQTDSMDENRTPIPGGAMPLDGKKQLPGWPTAPGCLRRRAGQTAGSGTSIFNPGAVLRKSPTAGSPRRRADPCPFAGGSVRGIVASKLGRSTSGMSYGRTGGLRTASQGGELCADDDTRLSGSRATAATSDLFCSDVSAGMVFSCPHYARWVYSDGAWNLSTMPYQDFRTVYFGSSKRLAPA